MKKTAKSTAKKAKSKAKKTAAGKRSGGPRRKPAKVTKATRQPASTVATARKPAARTRPKKKSGTDIDRLGHLPRSYEEERLFVVAQEPHWLFCYWDFMLSEGIEGALFLRHGREGADHAEAEVPVPAETNSWYLAVREADVGYYVELGYYHGTRWQRLVRSGTVLTPRDTPAGFGEAVFANMPFHASFQQLVEQIRGTMRVGESLVAALARLQACGELPVDRLTTAQRLSLDRLLDTRIGSLTSGQLSGYWATAPGGSSGDFLAALGISGTSRESSPGSWSSAVLPGREVTSGGISSWHKGKTRGFFMHLNAEVIFYGGTAPGSRVTVDGKEITIRPDGTFRCHFVLPDGEFEIPIEATSPHGLETRRGVLRFERSTPGEGDTTPTVPPPLGAPMGRKDS